MSSTVVEGLRRTHLRRWCALLLAVLVGLVLVLELVRAALDVRHLSPTLAALDGAATLLALGALAVACLRGLGRAVSAAFLVAQVAAAVVAGGLSDDGGGVDAGPTFAVLIAVVYAHAVLATHRRELLIVAVSAVVHVVGRGTVGGSSGLVAGLDEAVTLGGSGLALGLLLSAMWRAADQDDLLQRRAHEVRIAQARDEEREQHREAAYRVLHDDVISALILVQRQESARDAATETAARRALTSLDGLLAGTISAPRMEQVAGIRLAPGSRWDVSALPQDVADAMGGAVAEALRNVARHAGVDTALVTTRRHDGRHVVTITDHGRGFDPDATPGYGITSSIVGRLEEVGGAASLDSSPAGTTVTLTWAPDDTDLTPPKTALHLNPRYGLSIAIVTIQLLAQFWLAVRYGWTGPEPVASALLSVLTLGAGIGQVAWVFRRPSRSRLAFSALLSLLLLGAGLALAGDGALRGFDSWIVGLGEGGIIAAALSGRLRAAVLTAAAYSAIVTGWAVRDPTLGPVDVLGPVLQPLMHVTMFGLGVAAMRHTAREAARHERDIADAALAEVRRDALAELRRLQLTRATPPVADLLARVLSEGVDESKRAEAALLVAGLRDEMYAPWLLDDGTRDALARLRRSGATVTVRAPGPSTEAHDALRVLLHHLPAAPGRQVVASAIDRARLVITPPLDEATAHLLVATGAQVVQDEATVVTAT